MLDQIVAEVFPMRRLALSVFVFVTALPATGAAQTATSFNVTASFSPLEWLVDGQANPTLTLIRGQTYTFNLSGTSGHTFFIKTVAGVTGTADSFDEGVANNGLDEGTLTFAVPADAPDQLFYQCGIHSVMTGSLVIQTRAMPALGTDGLAVLALAVLVAGLVLLRRGGAVRL